LLTKTVFSLKMNFSLKIIRIIQISCESHVNDVNKYLQHLHVIRRLALLYGREI